MEKRKSLAILGAVVLILALLAVPFITGCPAAQEEAIKLGCILDYTGPMASTGPMLQEGIELRLEEANYKVAGREIQVIFEDGASDTAISLDKAKKLVEMDKVDFVIGPPLSGPRMGMIPYLAEQKILTTSIHCDPPEAAQWGNAFVYPSTLEMASLPLAWYVVDELGYKTTTTVGADYVAGRTFVGSVVGELEKDGGTAVQQQWAPLGTMDWGPYLVNMQEADCVVVWTIDSDIVPFMQQYKEFGLTMPVLMPMGNVILQSMIEERGEIFEGVVGCIEYYWGLDTPANNSFVAAYEAKFGTKPEHHQAMAYATASMFLAGVEKTGGDTSFEPLKEAILGLDIETPSGPLSFEPNGIGISNWYICDVQMIDGQWGWHTLHTYEQAEPTGS